MIIANLSPLGYTGSSDSLSRAAASSKPEDSTVFSPCAGVGVSFDILSVLGLSLGTAVDASEVATVFGCLGRKTLRKDDIVVKQDKGL